MVICIPPVRVLAPVGNRLLATISRTEDKLSGIAIQVALGGPAGSTIHQDRADHQPQDGRGTRHHLPDLVARPRRQFAVVLRCAMLNGSFYGGGAFMMSKTGAPRIALIGYGAIADEVVRS